MCSRMTGLERVHVDAGSTEAREPRVLTAPCFSGSGFQNGVIRSSECGSRMALLTQMCFKRGVGKILPKRPLWSHFCLEGEGGPC